MNSLLILNDIDFDKENSDFTITKNHILYHLLIDLPLYDNKYIDNETNEPDINSLLRTINTVCLPYNIPQNFFTNDIINYHFPKSIVNALIDNHCVLSSLDTCISLLSQYESNSISNSKLFNKYKNIGYLSLKEINKIDSIKLPYINDKITEIKSFSTIVSRIKKSITELSSTTTQHDTLGYSIFVLADQLCNSSTIKINNSAFFYETTQKLRYLDTIIADLNKNILFSNRRSKNIYKTFIDKYNDLSFFKISNSLKYNYSQGYLADSILHYYKVERYYNFNLINFILNKINDTKTLNNPSTKYLTDAYMLELLAKSQLLPNSYSRNWLITEALNYLIEEHNLFSNFGSDNTDRNIVNAKEIPLNADSHLIQWYNLFDKFINYTSYVTFPIYEKSFFILLFYSIKSNNKNYSKEKILNIMIKTLKEYISNNPELITCNFMDLNFKSIIDNYDKKKSNEYKDKEDYLFHCLNSVESISKYIKYNYPIKNNLTSNRFDDYDKDSYDFSPITLLKSEEIHDINYQDFITLAKTIYKTNDFNKLYQRNFDFNYFHNEDKHTKMIINDILTNKHYKNT